MRNIILAGFVALLTWGSPVYSFGDYVDESQSQGQGQAQGQGQLQGQAQGQLQGQGQGQGQQQGINRSGNSHQGQAQGIFDSGNAHQGQGQGQVGIVKNVGPAVVITETNDYEAAASPAIAADVSAPAPTAGCRYSQGLSLAGQAVGGGAGIGHTTSEYDPICGAWVAAKQTVGPAQQVATTIAYCLTWEEAEVEVAACQDWRTKVSGGTKLEDVAFNPDNNVPVSFERLESGLTYTSAVTSR